MKDKICFITGADGAIGRAMTTEFIAAGMKVIATDLSFKKRNTELSSVTYYNLDVTKYIDIQKLFTTINDNTCIDVLVNCAGILRSKPFEHLTVQEWNQTLSVNLSGTFYTSQAAYQLMQHNNNGVIINIASDAGEIGSTMSSADYAASKAGVIALTKCIAREGARYGIRANCIAPGFIESEMLDKFKTYWGVEKLNQTVNEIPLKRMGKPEEVAKLAVYLASDAASYITGATLDLNGGSCMN
ncbi:MAG: SDR family oxidoreductase [Cloacibacillus sp.]